MQPPEEFLRPFEELLQGSVQLAILAHDNPITVGWSNTLARHSVMDSLLLLEAVANTCLESLEIEKSVLEELDRLPVIAKYDIYLRTAFSNRKLNRGLQAIAELRDLKQLRDSFAHAKKERVVWQSWTENGSISTCEKTAALGIPRSPLFWDEESAVAVMRAVHKFLSFYFQGLCKFKPGQVTLMLFSEERKPSRKEGRMASLWDIQTLKRVKEWGVNLCYIQLDTYSTLRPKRRGQTAAK